MTGSVFKKGKYFYIKYDLGKDMNGKRMQKTEGGFDTKKQAQKALRQRVDEVENSFANKIERCTLSAYLESWIETYCIPRLARNTCNGYKTNIRKHIIPVIGHIQLDKLEPHDIIKVYSTATANGLAPTSVLYIHNTLHKALKTAVKARKLPYNVSDYVEAPQRLAFKSAVLTAEEALKLINTCIGTDMYIPIKLAIMLGLRRGEVLGLKWSDIDYKYKTISIKRTATAYKNEGIVYSDVKTQKSLRTILMSDSMMNDLISYKKYQEENNLIYDDLIVLRNTGKPMTPSVLNNQFKRYMELASIPRIRFHDLRHTCATLMLKENVQAKIVSSMLGHANIGITLDTYTHVMTDMQKPAVDAMENAIFGKPVILL